MQINPLLLFYAYTGLLIIGALINNNTGNLLPIEVYFMFIFVTITVTLHRASRGYVVNMRKRMSSYDEIFINLFCVLNLILTMILFWLNGVPLLSDNPNVARMDLFRGGSLMAKGFYLLPINIMLVYTALQFEKKKIYYVYFIASIVCIVLASNKSAFINIFFALLLGAWSVGKRIPKILIAALSILLVFSTLVMFSVVAQDEVSSQSVSGLLIDRLTAENELGLRVCFDYAPALGSGPALEAMDSIISRIRGYDAGYPVSTGRVIATYYYNIPQFSDLIWEFTVTGFCDSNLLLGTIGVIVYAIIFPIIIIASLRNMGKAGTISGKMVWSLLFYQLFSIFTGGNFLAQIFGFLGQSWLLVAIYAIITNSLLYILNGPRIHDKVI